MNELYTIVVGLLATLALVGMSLVPVYMTFWVISRAIHKGLKRDKK